MQRRLKLNTPPQASFHCTDEETEKLFQSSEKVFTGSSIWKIDCASRIFLPNGLPRVFHSIREGLHKDLPECSGVGARRARARLAPILQLHHSSRPSSSTGSHNSNSF